MRRLETLEFWDELISFKDELSLRELAGRFGVTPGAISAALKRMGVARQPAPPGPRSARRTRAPDQHLPPEAGEHGLVNVRPGSKDHLIHAQIDQVGKVPDAEIARLAGVSVRTVASFRARNKIAGYSGPRRSAGQARRRRSRIDPYSDMLGTVPDRVVADEAGVSLNAVRNYRVKHGIRAAGQDVGDAPVNLVPGAQQAWRVCLRTRSGVALQRVVLAGGIRAAMDAAESSTLVADGGLVLGVEWVGALLID